MIPDRDVLFGMNTKVLAEVILIFTGVEKLVCPFESQEFKVFLFTEMQGRRLSITIHGNTAKSESLYFLAARTQGKGLASEVFPGPN